MRISRGWIVIRVVLGLGLGAACGLGYPAQPRSGQSLPETVFRALADAGIPPDAVSVVVQEASEPEPLLRWNGEVPRSPASLMKLVTTYAALHAFGPARTWETRATGGPVRNGRLDGNLYLVGDGDPDLTLERWGALLRELRIRGVRQIGGDVVLDESAFRQPAEDPDAFDHQGFRPYNTAPEALQVGFKAVTLALEADSGRVLVLPDFDFPALRIVNRVQAVGGACPEDWKSGIERRVAAAGNRVQIVLQGRFPASCGRKSLSFSVFSNEQYIGQAFRKIWRELGGTLAGTVRPGNAPPGLPVLASTRSPPLAELMRQTNKYSNNLMARTLFLDLGRNGDGPGTPAAAAERVQALLASRGLVFPELVLENGSGLSRRERISADHLNALLLQAGREPTQAEFIASLALAGQEGTVEQRKLGELVEGRFHLKTGSLEGVSGIAGYGDTLSGRRICFVFLVNHPHAAEARPAQDALLRWIGEMP